MHSESAKVQMRESNFSDYSLYTSMQTHSDETRAVGGRCFRIGQFIPPQAEGFLFSAASRRRSRTKS